MLHRFVVVEIVVGALFLPSFVYTPVSLAFLFFLSLLFSLLFSSLKKEENINKRPFCVCHDGVRVFPTLGVAAEASDAAPLLVQSRSFVIW